MKLNKMIKKIFKSKEITEKEITLLIEKILYSNLNAKDEFGDDYFKFTRMNKKYKFILKISDFEETMMDYKIDNSIKIIYAIEMEHISLKYDLLIEKIK